MESSILSEVDNTSDSQDGLSTRLLLSSQLATNLSALAPAKRAGAQRLCALALSGLSARSIPTSAFGGEPDYRQSAPRRLRMTHSALRRPVFAATPQHTPARRY